MTLYKRSLDLPRDLLVSSMVGMMRVILIFWKRARRIPRRVPVVAKKQQRGGEQKKDISKVKLFASHKMGRYVGECPHMKKNHGGTAAADEEDDFTSQFERE